MKRTEAKSLPGGNLVAEFLRDLEQISSVDNALEVLASATTQLGFSRVDYSYLDTPRLLDGSWAPPPVITRNFPKNWEASWDDHRANDPYYHACFNSGPIVRWKDIQQRENLTSAQIDSWHYLADKELEHGITIPVHLPRRMGFAFVSVIQGAGEIAKIAEEISCSSTLIFLTHHFHYTISGKFGLLFPRQQSGSLTSRELECLEWVSKGKTTDEIACILDRSPETIRIHIKRCCTKLAAANRTHAVAKAYGLGLIGFPS
ncbi:LuxR family transcriptional regulator [Paracoccus sp. FO-3]|uniref:helix-turn-helix transcriptional regulator n=1 Tax=Paracoccus sp. FO-3 TaxID=1335059 RepID=UPI00112882DA|nr:LuxR family transcriptional regulator [Paracoccus sp. FO-3]